MHGFGRNIPCSKGHIHQSSIGRRSAWKWLVLCRQTNAEAILYHPVYRNEMKLRVASDDCARCGYDRGPVLEWALHAALTPKIGDRYKIEGHCLAMVRILSLELDTEEVDREQEPEASPRHDRQRFTHNLASIVSLIAGLNCLEKFTLTVFGTFHKTMVTNTGVADSVAQLFHILHQKKEQANSIDFSIIQTVIAQMPSVLQPGAPDQISDGDTIEPLLQVTGSVGFKRSEIFTSEVQDRRKNYSTVADITASLESPIQSSFSSLEEGRPATSAASQSADVRPELYRVADFDEDFNDIPEEEKIQINKEEEIMANGGFIFRWPCGPTFYEDTSGCVRTETAKYSRICLRRHSAPLYLMEDLY